MFESLDEHIRHGDEVEQTRAERIFKWAAMVLLSVLVFGGLYFGIQMLE